MFNFIKRLFRLKSIRHYKKRQHPVLSLEVVESPAEIAKRKRIEYVKKSKCFKS
jgi:hypothetical protein